MGQPARRRVRAVVDPLLGRAIGSVHAGSSTTHIVLTLDDGPEPSVTPLMLDLLAELGLTASWFLLAGRAELYPTLVERMVREGHEVSLHGLDHRRVSTMARAEAFEYLRVAKDMLEQIAGVDVLRFRPPYGSQSLTSFLAARRAGLEVVVWSADAQDWVDRTGSQVARDASDAVKAGGILLLHERLEPDPLRDSPSTTFDRIEMVRELGQLLAERRLAMSSLRDLEPSGPLVRTVWFRP